MNLPFSSPDRITLRSKADNIDIADDGRQWHIFKLWHNTELSKIADDRDFFRQKIFQVIILWNLLACIKILPGTSFGCHVLFSMSLTPLHISEAQGCCTDNVFIFSVGFWNYITLLLLN